MDQLKFRYLTDEILILHAISALPKVPLYFNGNVFTFKTRDILEQRTKYREAYNNCYNDDCRLHKFI